jgi:hypothetical protein
MSPSSTSDKKKNSKEKSIVYFKKTLTALKILKVYSITLAWEGKNKQTSAPLHITSER